MREILFRGKRVDNGKWVEGYYVYDESGQITEKPIAYIYHLHTHPCGWAIIPYVVDPETVGQYTGIKDKSGKNGIFEGDIVATKYKLGRGGYYVFEVYYNENLCQFALTINSGSYTKNKQYDWLQLTSLKANKVEVIGNIHDNPELLENP